MSNMDSLKCSRFELSYDIDDLHQNNFQYYNKPLNAKLKQYSSAHPRTLSQSSVPGFLSNFDTLIDRDLDSISLSHSSEGYNPFNYLYSKETPTSDPTTTHAFNRSVSLPAIKQTCHEHSLEHPSKPVINDSNSASNSRKSSVYDRSNSIRSRSRSNSFFCNCVHSENKWSPVRCRGSIVTLNDDNQVNSCESDEDSSNSGEGGDCKRHHHRRGSVAIKFKKPELINQEDQEETMIDGDLTATLQSFKIK